MVTISPKLEDKIERRARRAFRYHDEGTQTRFHRITSVTKSSLKYRIPRSGRKRVEVVRTDTGDILIDPPNTDARDLLKTADLSKLKSDSGKLHQGEITGYIVTDKVMQAGDKSKKKLLKKLDGVISREKAEADVTGETRVYQVKIAPGDLTEINYTDIQVSAFTVEKELDKEKDLGFTTGFLDCRTKDDVLKLQKKRHIGKVRAYKFTDEKGQSPYQSPKLTYVPGKDYEIKDPDTDPNSACHRGVNVADYEWAKRYASGKNRIFAFEFDAKDIAAVPTNTDGKFRVARCKCVEEIDKTTDKALVPPPTPVEGGGRIVPKKKGFFGKLFGGKDGEDE